MRKLTAAMEGNQMLQVVVLGGLAVLMGALMYMRVLHHPQPSTNATPPVAAQAAPAGSPSTTTPSRVAPTTGSPAPPAPSASLGDQSGAAPVAPGGAPPSAAALSKPGPGIPAPVASAYASGKAVVLLVDQRDGIPTRVNRHAAALLSARPDLAVFEFDVSQISKYSRITQGVDISRAPAIVVVQPAADVKDATPEATVRYGYMGGQNVLQVVQDALYVGPTLPYYPE